MTVWGFECIYIFIYLFIGGGDMLNNMNKHIVHGAELKDAENRKVISLCKEV